MLQTWYTCKHQNSVEFRHSIFEITDFGIYLVKNLIINMFKFTFYLTFILFSKISLEQANRWTKFLHLWEHGQFTWNLDLQAAIPFTVDQAKVIQVDREESVYSWFLSKRKIIITFLSHRQKGICLLCRKENIHSPQ